MGLQKLTWTWSRV